MSQLDDLVRRVEMLEQSNSELRGRLFQNELTLGPTRSGLRNVATSTAVYRGIRAWPGGPFFGIREDSASGAAVGEWVASPTGDTDRLIDMLDANDVYCFLNWSDANGVQLTLTTTWVPIGQTAASAGGLELISDFSWWPVPFTSHKFWADLQDDTAASDVEVRLRDTTNGNDLMSKTGIGGGAGTRVTATQDNLTTSDLPTSEALIQAQWRRASGSGAATIYGFNWMAKREPRNV